MTLPVVLSALALCVSVSSFFFFRRYIKRKVAVSQQLAEYRDAVAQLNAGIDTVTDRDLRLVEERIKTLRKLLEETDRRIKVYVQEIRRDRNAEMPHDSLGRSVRASGEPVPAPAPQEQPLLFSAEQEAEASAPGGKNPEDKPGPAQLQAETEAREAEAPPDKSELKARIARMAAEEVPAHEIASGLGISVAEVELAMDLMNRPVDT